MDTQTKLLEARNALHLCESLLLEAFAFAPQPVAVGIENLLVSLTSDRESIASLHQLAALLPSQSARGEAKKKRLQRKSESVEC